jgi:hypothetical protein
MKNTIIVPVGKKLVINAGATVNAFSCTRLVVLGTLEVNGTDGAHVTFSCVDHPGATTAWQGIAVFGTAQIHYLTVKNAKRGLAVLTATGAVSIANCTFTLNRVGVHLYQSSPTVTGCRFASCEWYGVKEDSISPALRPSVKGCVFTQNGYDYYNDVYRNITMERLNTINGITLEAEKNKNE